MNDNLPLNWRYAVSLTPAPVLNSGDFRAVFGGNDGKSVKTDEQGLVRELEFIALKGTVFEITGENDLGQYRIFKAECEEYQYDAPLFIDSRFVNAGNKKPPAREKKLPAFKQIIDFLDRAVGWKYCWGGNYINGINKMLEYYKPSGNITAETENLWTLKGCDCSGLMYEATNGFTERNTGRLISSGTGLDIEGMKPEEIAGMLRPLDMLVWEGHVIYVYDKVTAIQSSLSRGGVIKSNLINELQELMKKRKPVNDYVYGSGPRFTARRWFEGK